MASINRVILAGNLTSDPILRKTPAGHSVCDMRLAVNETYKTQSGATTEKTLFIDIVVWERQAENCAKYLAKGSSVIIDGRLRQDEFKTKEGENRSKITVIAQNVQFTGSPSGREDRQNAAGSAPSQSEPHTPASDAQFNGGDSDDDVPF